MTLPTIGKYTVLGVLGEGGMSTVYEAEESASRRRVALKVLEAGLGASPRVRELFVAEMAILDRIRHPHVVGFIESLEVDGRLVMVLELLRGETLRDLLRRCSRLAWPEAITLISQVLSGLSAAHAQQPPVVHRDLKPENIMITHDRTVKVMDFGIAKVIREGTRATTDVGTLEYMCPEQIEGMHIDQRADLYNVGLILYEMLVGAPPFQSHSTRELLNAQCTAPPPALPPVIAHAVPASLVQLMLQLLAKSPHQRPSSAEEVLQRLDAIVLSPGASAMSMVASSAASGSAVPTGTSWATPPPKPSPFVAVLGSVIAVVLFLSVGTWLLFGRYLREPAAEPSKQTQVVSDAPREPATDAQPSTPSAPTSNADADPPAAAAEPPRTEPSDAKPSLRVAAIVCLVDGRTPDVKDFVVLQSRAGNLTLHWLDGTTGETYRKTEIEQYRIYCIDAQTIGVLRDEDTKLDLIDAPTGEVASTTTVEHGLNSLVETRTGATTPQLLASRQVVVFPRSGNVTPADRLLQESYELHRSYRRQLDRTHCAPNTTAVPGRRWNRY